MKLKYKIIYISQDITITYLITVYSNISNKRPTLTVDHSEDAAAGARRNTCTSIGSDAHWKTPMASSCDDLDTSIPLT